MVFNNLKQYVLVFLLFFLPLLFFPSSIGWFELPKVIIAECGISLLIFLTVFSHNNCYESFPLVKKRFYSVIFLLTVIDLLFFRSATSFFGNNTRQQGILLVWYLLLFSLVATKLKVPLLKNNISFLAQTFLLFFTLILGKTLDGRYYGTAGEPNALAAFAGFFFAFSVYRNPWSNKYMHKIYPFILFLITFLITLLSHSRSGMIALAIEIIFVLLIRKRVSYIKIITICMCLLVFSLSLPFFSKSQSWDNRTLIWQSAVLAGWQSPIVGNGFGNLQLSLSKSAKNLHTTIQYENVDSSHNIFLDWWVQGGIIGVGALISLLIFSILSLVRANDKEKLTALLGLLVIVSFNPASVSTLLQLWWLI